MSSARNRLVLYALLSAVEKDLRRAISDFVLPFVQLKEAFGEEVIGGLIDRCRRDNGDISDPQSLLDYSNLADALHVLSRNSSFLGEKGRKSYKAISKNLDQLVPIRNRVMHTRPLQFDDYPMTFETCKRAVKSHPILWRELSETIHKVEDDPAYLLNLSITPPEGEVEEILQNLPTPDFDDTGFIGREEELSTIIKAIKGPYPVITITGEGGLGKTALALKSCYDLIDSEDCEFDAVIWTSAKTSRLTPSEIEEITSAVNSSIGIFDAATEALGLDQNGEPITRLLEQLNDFRILLVIDNLETVLDENVRKVVRDVPTGSKILFTSRVSIGAFDYPIPLTPLGDTEALTYFRSCARYWGLKDFVRLTNKEIGAYLKKLYNNPLFIKWFLQSVAQGQNPNRILANPKIILEFCLSNVVENLSKEANVVLETMVFLGDARPISILSLMTELHPMSVERAVNELTSSNLVDIVDYASSDKDPKFQATNLAKFYVRNYVDVLAVNQSEIVRRKKELAVTREQLLRVNAQNEFDMNQIRLRGEEDIPPAKLLKDAILHIKKKNYPEARRLAENAIEISPNYFESFRVLAGACTMSGSFMKAQDCYESAVSLFPDYAPLRLWYGDFLMRHLDDLSGAKEQYERAISIQPEAPQVRTSWARLLQIEGNIDESRAVLNSLMSQDGLAPRLRRRIAALLLQSYVREIERLAQIDELEMVLKELSELKEVYLSIPLANIDAKTKGKVRFAKEAVIRVGEFFAGTESEPFSESLVEWFLLEFGASAKGLGNADTTFGEKPLESEALEPELSIGDVGEGVLMKIHSGFGFIASKGQSIFFPFSEWKSNDQISQCMIGEKVKFTVGRNHKGVCAERVSLLSSPASSSHLKVNPVSIYGIIETCRDGYAFVKGEDGVTYFLPGSELQNTNIQIANLAGSRILFDGVPQVSGRHPRATNATLVFNKNG